MKKKSEKKKSKIAKIIDNINHSELDINCTWWFGSNNFYLIPTIYISKGYYLEFVFTIFNIMIDIGFKIKKDDN